MGCPRQVVHASRAGTSMAIAWAHGDWAVHGEVALSASRSQESLALAPLGQQKCRVIPDVVGGTEAGSLPAQPGQHEPTLTLSPHQLRLTQHLLHQLPVPPDACSHILWRKGGSDKCLTWGLTWGLSQHKTGSWGCTRQEQRGQGTAPWPGAASLGAVMPSFGSAMLLWLYCRWAFWKRPQSVVLPPLLPVSLPGHRCSAAPGCSAAAALMPA